MKWLQLCSLLACGACVTDAAPPFHAFPTRFDADQVVTMSGAGNHGTTDQWLAQVRRDGGRLTVLFLEPLTGRPIVRLDGDDKNVQIDWLTDVPDKARTMARPAFESMLALFRHRFAAASPLVLTFAAGTYELSGIEGSEPCRFPTLIMLKLRDAPVKLRIETHDVACDATPVK